MQTSADGRSRDEVNDTDYPVEKLFRHRWSPYRFEPRGVETGKLLRCLEAARWSASSYNEQPWSWIIARREETDAFETMIGCLAEANQEWARNAGALLLTVTRGAFARSGQPNRVALHDLGLAAAQLTLQATAEGLQVHQMAGVNLSRVRVVYEIPEGYDPQTAIAIGYPATDPPADNTQRELEKRDRGPRNRKPLADQVFAGKFGVASEIARSSG